MPGYRHFDKFDKYKFGIVDSYREGVARRLVERFKNLLLIHARDGTRRQHRTVEPSQAERGREFAELRGREHTLCLMHEELLRDERTLKYLNDSVYSALDDVSHSILSVMVKFGAKAIPEILYVAQRLRTLSENKNREPQDRKTDLDLYHWCLRRIGEIDGSIQCLFDTLRPSPYQYVVAEALAFRGSAIIPYFCFLWQLNQERHKDTNSEHMRYLSDDFDRLVRRSIELKSDIYRDERGIVFKYGPLVLDILGERRFAEALDMLDPAHVIKYTPRSPLYLYGRP